ncbi:hypothetical protein HPB47_012347 [Ixodes persulcatus]|uniref:Uncharacterized protein n=1 Tax=Ixodes persulcatus TaxID=34615 RepID=A0AC60NTQ9_IXOPE|nr:hypothetical protein HPB47_012347 [Ixodes persulcatus]
MKVNIAVQFFRDAPPAIRYRVDQGQLPPETESTAWFCELQHQTAIRTLDLTARTFRQMKMGVTAHWKPSQAGVISSTTVLYQLQEDLLNEHDYAYLLTGRLTQDCLENVFSVVRLKKPVPSALEFNGRAPLQEPAAVKEDIMDDFLIMMTKKEGHIFAYVGGFLVRAAMRTRNGNTYKGALTSDSNGEYSTLIRLKEYVRGSENLTYPSHAVLQFLTACEEQFKGLTSTTEILNLASPFKTIVAVLRKNSSLVSKACSAHKDNEGRLLLHKYLHFRLKIHLKQARLENRSSGHSSKTCAGVNLL